MRNSIWKCWELQELRGTKILPSAMLSVLCSCTAAFSLSTNSIMWAERKLCQRMSKLSAGSKSAELRAMSTISMLSTGKLRARMRPLPSTMWSLRTTWAMSNAFGRWLLTLQSLPTAWHLQPNVLSVQKATLCSATSPWKLQASHKLSTPFCADDKWHNLQEVIRFHWRSNRQVMSTSSCLPVWSTRSTLWKFRNGYCDETFVPSSLLSWTRQTNLPTLTVSARRGSNASVDDTKTRFCSEISIQEVRVQSSRQHQASLWMHREINNSAIVIHATWHVQLHQSWVLQADHQLQATRMWVEVDRVALEFISLFSISADGVWDDSKAQLHAGLCSTKGWHAVGSKAKILSAFDQVCQRHRREAVLPTTRLLPSWRQRLLLWSQMQIAASFLLNQFFLYSLSSFAVFSHHKMIWNQIKLMWT